MKTLSWRNTFLDKKTLKVDFHRVQTIIDQPNDDNLSLSTLQASKLACQIGVDVYIYTQRAGKPA